MVTDLIKVEEFTSIIQTAPDSLNRNQTSVEKSNQAGQCLLDTIQGAGGLNDALDTEVAKYLDKIRVTKAKMEERRKPLTQLFDQIRRTFTTLESNIDLKDGMTIPGKLSFMRDQYAAKKFAEEKKRKEESLRKANIDNEKVSYKNALELELNRYYNAYFNSQSGDLASAWESITFDNYDIKAKLIRGWSLVYPIEHFNQFRKELTTYYLDAMTKGAIKAEAFSGKYESFSQQYRFDMEDLRQSFIDRLSSKFKELQENEELRKTNAKAAEQAEKERKDREEKERQQRELEAKQKEEKQKIDSLAAAQVGQMNSLFDASAATLAPAPIKAKVTEKIKVLNPAGILEIYQMWWLNEGQSLPIEELEKIHKKMITFCEKKANKEDAHIKSQYVIYEEDVKAK